MNKKKSERLFLIIFFLVVLIISVTRLPFFKAKFNRNYRYKLFENFKTTLVAKNFNPEEFWQFRERFSPGTFIRDEDNTSFFATFKITNINKGITPLFYYHSSKLLSLDGLTQDKPDDALKKVKQEFDGEVIASSSDYLLIKQTDNEYIFVFVLPTKVMQEVDGMFDYLPEEQELIKDNYWYSASYIDLR